MKVPSLILIFFLSVLFIIPPCVIAEEVTVTTYYPSPEGKYKKLETTDQTLLATDATSATAKVGIGTETPAANLDVVGTVKITDGTQGAGKILVSDAAGMAHWADNSTPVYRVVTNSGVAPNYVSRAACNENEHLVSGGGLCGPAGYLQHNGASYDSNGKPTGWVTDCYHRNDLVDVSSQAWAICSPD